MGMEKKQCVIRWMGTCFLKVASMMKIGIFVNETAALKVIWALFYIILNIVF